MQSLHREAAEKIGYKKNEKNLFQEDDHRNSVHHDDNNHHGNHSDTVKSNAVPNKTREPVVVQPTSEQLMIAQVGASA